MSSVFSVLGRCTEGGYRERRVEDFGELASGGSSGLGGSAAVGASPALGGFRSGR